MSVTALATRIFIVEDDPIYSRMVQYVASMNPDHIVQCFSTAKECIANLHHGPAIISIDYSLSDMSGEELLKKILKYDPRISVIVLSGQKDINVAVSLLKIGAYDYIVKGDQVKDRLFHTIENIKRKVSLQLELDELKDELSEKYNFEFGSLVGKSPVMKKMINLVKKAVKTNISVSITGETGSGKEVVARSIHYNSLRRKGKFVAVNVAAIPNELLESELFGYEKGAFTGAIGRKPGKFELADGGTIFLDEIGEMNISLQAKLLRAIQEREIVRLGGNDPVPFDARIIVSTHRDLAKEVQLGNFREDLYYRLLGLPITVPPLRDRSNDILLLMRYFLDEFTNQNNLPRLALSVNAKNKLFKYDYPGNVRELKAVIELAAVMSEGTEIQAADIVFKSPQVGKGYIRADKTLKEHTLDIIHHYLDQHDQDVRFVAKKLNIGKSTIYRLLKDEASETPKTNLV